jgi:hypothetical protein
VTYGAPVGEPDIADRGLGVIAQLGRDDPLWPGQLATFVALALYLALPQTLTIGPGWPLPVAEAVVLAALVIATWSGRGAARRRSIAICLVLVALLANLSSLGLLTNYLLGGGRARGSDLLEGGVLIWTTSLLLFAVLYWELDRGGPRRPADKRAPQMPDFLFTPMTAADFAAPGWKPSFGDYLYLSVTNQTAFSPTDTLPLRLRAKALMGVQGVAALITTGVIVARAVNILG